LVGMKSNRALLPSGSSNSREQIETIDLFQVPGFINGLMMPFKQTLVAECAFEKRIKCARMTTVSARLAQQYLLCHETDKFAEVEL
jgi:hypothetical protein